MKASMFVMFFHSAIHVCIKAYKGELKAKMNIIVLFNRCWSKPDC